jgi:hypothetical protein
VNRAVAVQAPTKSGQRTAWMMPVACGVFVGALVFDAVPTAVGAIGLWAFAWASAGLGLMLLTTRMAKRRGLGLSSWIATAGICFHSILEGVGAGAGLKLGLGGLTVVTLGLIVHLIPEGTALYTLLTEAGVSPARALARCAMTWSFVLAGLVGTQTVMEELPAAPLGAAMGMAGGTFAFLAWVLWKRRQRGSTTWAATAALGVLWVAVLHLA